jgi:hypothetical protein
VHCRVLSSIPDLYVPTHIFSPTIISAAVIGGLVREVLDVGPILLLSLLLLTRIYSFCKTSSTSTCLIHYFLIVQDVFP